MEDSDKKKFFGNSGWVTYLSPFTLIVPDAEKPLNVDLEEINSNTYNHGILCQIVTSLNVEFFECKLLVCYDGALALPKFGRFSQKEDAVNYFSDVLCRLLLGGVYCEAIDRRDVVNGQLYKKRAIWPVDLGSSASAHTHSKLRMRMGSSIDSIILSNPQHITVSNFHRMINVGNDVFKRIPNLTAKFLLRGITEIRYKNWDLVLSNLWITVEQLIDFLWNCQYLDDAKYHTIQQIDGRIPSLKSDSRTWNTSVKLEILFQVGILDEEIVSRLFPARKARNKLVHEGIGVTEAVSVELYRAVGFLLKKAANYDMAMFNLDGDTYEDFAGKPNYTSDFFDDWHGLN